MERERKSGQEEFAGIVESHFGELETKLRELEKASPEELAIFFC